MKSKILATTKLDDELLARDVATILGWERPPQEYSEYAFGTFHTLVLASPEGSPQGTRFDGLAGRAEPTALGRSLGYIPSFVENMFDTSRLIMMRGYLLQDAVLIPHCDYVEFGEDAQKMVRLHVPLQTNLQALHSEEDVVFHMNVGEVWYLDVTTVHSACNGAPQPRLSLVMDFRLDGSPIESVFRNRSALDAASKATIIERAPVDKKFIDGILALGHVIDASSYRDIVRLLSRIHFHRAVHAGTCFDWLVEICIASGDPALVTKSDALRRFLVARRQHGERFDL